MMKVQFSRSTFVRTSQRAIATTICPVAARTMELSEPTRRKKTNKKYHEFEFCGNMDMANSRLHSHCQSKRFHGPSLHWQDAQFDENKLGTDVDCRLMCWANIVPNSDRNKFTSVLISQAKLPENEIPLWNVAIDAMTPNRRNGKTHLMMMMMTDREPYMLWRIATVPVTFNNG